MKTTKSGSEQVIDSLTEYGLDQTSAEQAVQPIASLLNRIVDHSWTLADEQNLTGRGSQFRRIISQTITGAKCDGISWVSLQKSFRPKNINWLNQADYVELWDAHAELTFKFLYRSVDIPLGILTWMADLSSLSPDMFQDVDNLWADLADLLPDHLETCLSREFEKAADYGVPSNLSELFVLCMFQPIHHYLTMCFIGDRQGAQKLLPLLGALQEGVLPLGTSRPSQPDKTIWLVAIA